MFTSQALYSLEDKQDPDFRAAFKQKLTQLLARTNADPQRLQVWFWDESGFSLRVKHDAKGGRKRGSVGKF